MIVLNVSDLVTGYGDARVLQSINLSVSDGGALAILGRNGAGKSTLLKSIIGLLPIWSGHVTYRDVTMDDRSSDARARLGIGYVPEDRRIFGTLSVQENLLTGAKPDPNGKSTWSTSRVFDLFPELHRRRDAAAGTLSGGERQMLSIARALMGNPTILMLDEPSEGLAPVIVNRLVPTLRSLQANGIGLLVAEQNHALAARISERAVIMETGRIVYDGKFSDLKAAPEILARHLGV